MKEKNVFFDERNIVFRALRKGMCGLFYFLPISRKKIVFDNFGGKGFGDDPKYIAQELLNRNLGLKLYWLVKGEQPSLPEGIIPLKLGSIRACYHMSTAAVWVDNIKNVPKVRKKKGQFYIQTWHSTLGFKKNEADAPTLSQNYVNKAKADAAKTDLMYSNNDFRLEKYRTRYWYSGPVLKCDVPRMGILLNPGEALRQQVYRSFGMDPEKKLVLYAPTFRKETDLEGYRFDYDRCLQVLEKTFSGSFAMLIRLHPNESPRAGELTEYIPQRICNASGYPDMQELLAVCDVLITDYSGCMFDFGFAEKPVFLLAKDLESYLAKDRQAYFSLDQLPFSLAQSSRELEENIAAFSGDAYRRACRQFKESIGLTDSGRGAQVIADIILEKLNPQ